jgi:alpha-beta hydrolase superfamily lysophospholipase
MESIVGPFKSVDFSALPPQEFVQARDGTRLAFRRYPSVQAKADWVVLIHGSSSSNLSLHPLSLGLSQAGWNVLAPDMRGHGDSGDRGHIRYIGQLEDDLEDLTRQLSLPGRKILAGFSSGGGFALRFAGSGRQGLFDAYLLLAPYLHYTASTLRKNSGGWVGVGVPRLIALLFLNRIGITALNLLPILAFALPPKDKPRLTPEYSYALMMNFQPREDYRSDIRRARKPMAVLVGDQDEVFVAQYFKREFQGDGGGTPVTLLPGLSHVGLILDPAGIHAVAESLKGFVLG